MSETIRAFIAIELDHPVKSALEKLQLGLNAGRVVRWTKPEQIHLTLKFLDDIPQENVQPITAALTSLCAQFKPFSLSLTQWGCFPNPYKPRIVWIGLGGALDVLHALQAGIDREMKDLCSHVENKPFTPHLTIGRTRQDARRQDMEKLGTQISSAPPPPATSWTVREVRLMRSELLPQGPKHTQLAAAALSA
ncbi:MAG TPA: RNA 2',3'-cyclic phosphodiesterase [Planctomycetota bacterium]|jgi:2'-5' RNA ligase